MHRFSRRIDLSRHSLVCAVLLSAVAAHLIHSTSVALERRLAECANGKGVHAIARVLSVEYGELFQRVTVDLAVQIPQCSEGDKRLRLTWPAELGQPLASERWQLHATVRTPWSLSNPGGFDYERWMLGHGLDGTGFVKEAQRVARAPSNWRDRLRAQAVSSLARAQRQGAVLRALALADSSGISQELWESFRRSGTVHLLVVSGLHIGVVAGLGAMLAAVLSRLMFPLFLRLAASHWMSIGGVGFAVAYVTLSGPAVPVLRALLMLIVGGMVLLSARRLGGWLAVGTAALGILAIMPMAIFQTGFWLSFGAVAVLVLSFSSRYQVPRALRAGRVFIAAQTALFIGLMPIVSAAVGVWSPFAPLANAVAVPLISLGVVPPLLLHLVVAPLSDGVSILLLQVADNIADWCVRWLRSQNWFTYLMPTQQPAKWLLATAACTLQLLPMSQTRRIALVPAVLVLLTPASPKLPDGVVRVHVLDVGQGSAALVETRSHMLLFDAGARYPSGFDIGARVVLPAIAQMPNRRLDAIVISHGDLDHAGGARAVRQAHPAAAYYASDTSAIEQGARSCHADGLEWRWDGVRFALITNRALAGASTDNDRSCVLLAEGQGGRVLITGDTGIRFEPFISRLTQSPVDLLVAPHHGSRTSSSLGFVRRVRPQWVVFSAGKSNRYGHPHPQILARYERVGSQTLISYRDGAIVWRSDRPDEVIRWREQHAKFWTQASST